MLKIGSIRWKGRCAKHQGYNPEIDGLGGIRGGCRRCEALLEIWTLHSQMIRLMREFPNREHGQIHMPASDAIDERQMSLLDSMG